MWRRTCAILFTLFGLLSADTPDQNTVHTKTLDVLQVCSGIRNGDVVKNPYDCRSYFVCSHKPILRLCEEALHFDAEKKVCNWPEYAKCNISTNSNTQQMELDMSGNAVVQQTDNADYVVGPKKFQPVFMAIDVLTSQATDPLSKYNPNDVNCRHFGAYFLPHPGNCRKYYLCAYGHLHQHRCGRGTLWNYLLEECEQSSEAICYGNSASGLTEPEIITPTGGTVTYSTAPPTGTTGTTGSTWHPTGSIYTATGTSTGTTGSTWHPTGSIYTATGTSTGTTESTWYPTGSIYTATAISNGITESTVVVTSNIGRVSPNCPTYRQAYIAHPDDCSKYYICISGKPVLTECPKGLLWHAKGEFCDVAQNVQCYDNAQ